MSNAATTKDESQTQFDLLCQQWRDIAVGGASQQARKFYRHSLLPVIAHRIAVSGTTEFAGNPVSGLVSFVGTTPETTILVTEATRPANLLLVASHGVQESVNVILDWFQSERSADRANPLVTTVICDPVNPKQMKDAVTSWIALQRKTCHGARLCIDATGGKKSMSMTAGMLAVTHQLELLYLDSEFDHALRAPRPGSEHLVVIAP